jgi:peptide/nickel transport system substrate-binding protein
MIRIVILLVFVISLFVVPVQAQQPIGDLIVALPNAPTSLYGPNGADVTAGNAARPLYDTLMRVDPTGGFMPALATAWEIGEDGLSYTFTLREGVTFHNDEEFTADDVVATWEFGSNEANQYSGYFLSASSVEATDDFTVVVSTAEPDPVFLTELANNWEIIPGDYMREVGIEGFEAAPIGTGPFIFQERIPGESISYVANENYWNEDQPGVASVTFRIIGDSSTRLAAVLSGDIHIANRLSTEEFALVEASDDVAGISYPTDRVYYAAFKNIGNGEGTPLENQLVRQAMNYAVDIDTIIDAIFGGAASSVASFTVPGTLGYDANLAPYPYDPDMAIALLEEAGFGEGFSIGIGCPSDAYLNINDVCLAIETDLEAVGIDVELDIMSTDVFWNEEFYGTTGPMYVDSWSSDLGEAINRLEGALRPGEYYATYTDEVIVDYMDRIGTTIDREARGTLYTELATYMNDNPPFIYLYQPVSFEAVSSAVQGYTPNNVESYFLNEITISE